MCKAAQLSTNYPSPSAKAGFAEPPVSIGEPESAGQNHGYDLPPSTNTRDHFKATIEEKRSYVRGEVRCCIPEISVDSFVKYLLPPLRSGVDVEGAVSCLKRDGLVTPSHQWKVFETPPDKGKESEGMMLAPLADIYRSLTEHASRQANTIPTFTLSLQSNGPVGSHRTKTAVPCGYFILREAEKRAQRATDKRGKVRWWYDIALAMEFKKGKSAEDRDDNVSKLVFDFQQALALDASRRFSFGITAENTGMRLWFCSRATPVVSQIFDFTSEVNILSHVFLSIAFASREELGWDPTIRSVTTSDGRRAYRIDVDDQTFETEEVLSDSAADALVSHAARVWIVRNVESGERSVLKDVWIDDDRDPEHAVREAILRDIEVTYGDAARQEAASHFLTPIIQWFVHVNGIPDHTTGVMMRGFTPSMRHRFTFRVRKPRIATAGDGLGHSTTSDAEMQLTKRKLRPPFPHGLLRRNIFRRKHYRIVYKEVAQDLYTIKKLSDSFLVLRDSAKGLKCVHGSGWVHRDLSVGNLYLFEGRGLIGDFEFAKRKNTDLIHERATGTPDFMSAETMERVYMYSPSDDEGQLDIDSSDLDSRDVNPPFFHNDLHDLESLWWASIWKLIFCRTIATAETGGITHDSAASELFGPCSRRDSRMLFFQNRRFFEARLTWIASRHSHFKRHLCDLRALLLRKYKSFEAEFPVVNLNIFGGTHDKFASSFETARINAVDMELSANASPEERSEPSVYDPSEVPPDPELPPLDQDSDCQSSEESSFEFDSENQEAGCVQTDHIGESKCVEEELQLAFYDFFVPMPSILAARYELEVC